VEEAQGLQTTTVTRQEGGVGEKCKPMVPDGKASEKDIEMSGQRSPVKTAEDEGKLPRSSGEQ